MKQLLSIRLLSASIAVIFLIYACSKGGSSGGTPNPCTSVSITLTGTTTNPTTPTATDGSINATAAGSTGFTYSIDGGAFQSSGNFTGLAAGAHTITAKNSSGCTGSGSFTLTAPNLCAGITITVTGTTVNPTTAGGTNGSITATATGSTGLTYNINGGAFQATGVFNNLGAGVYTIIAKNANGCSGTAAFTLTAPNACAGVIINVTHTVNGNVPCEANVGRITAAATGGTGTYTYSINGTNFQASNVFNNLANGNYTVTAKDANGCTGTSAAAVISDLPAGPLFSAVKTLVQNNCVTCHNAAVQNGGMNWTIDCNIVQFKDRIQARAVNGVPSPMPEGGLLPAAERQKITDWINAGGKYSN